MEANTDLTSEDTDQIARPTPAAVHKPPRRVPAHERHFSVAKQKLVEGFSTETAQAGLITGALAVAVFVLQHKWQRHVPPPLSRTRSQADSVVSASHREANDAQPVHRVQLGGPPSREQIVHGIAVTPNSIDLLEQSIKQAESSAVATEETQQDDRQFRRLLKHLQAFCKAYRDSSLVDHKVCCQHLEALLVLAHPKGKAVRQHLCNLKLLPFLIDEMRFESQQPLSAPPTMKLAPAIADSSLQARSRSLASPSPSKARALRSLSNSPSKQAATALQETVQPNAAPRDGAVHVPASAPSSSGVNSPSTSPLQRTPSQGLLRSVTRSLLNQQTQLLQQSSHRHSSDVLSENDTPKIPAHRANPHFGRATDRFQDENQPFGRSRPANGRGSTDKRFGELDAPAGFVPTGDLNEDADQLLRAQDQAQADRSKQEAQDDTAESLDVSNSDEDDGSISSSSCSEEEVRPTPARSLPRLNLGLKLPQKPAAVEDERAKWFIYKDPRRHLLMVQLALELLVDRQGELDPVYINPNLAEEQPTSILQQHLSSTANAGLTQGLSEWAATVGEPTQRLLRILSRFLFQADTYRERRYAAKGAFAEVHHCQADGDSHNSSADVPLALKVTDLPCSRTQNQKTLVTAFNEIGIMQRLKDLPGICKLHDYGIDQSSIYLVLTRYSSSLCAWREKQSKKCSSPQQLKLCLNIFCQVAEQIQALSEQEVVHFDLKCDNVLLDMLPGASLEDFWSPTTHQPAFRVVLADFGDSCDFSQSDSKFTTRIHGTECNYSPEMLVTSQEKEWTFASGRIVQGSSSPSDVWLLGCLLFELFTQEPLFKGDFEGFPKFWATVVDESEVLLSAERLAPVEDMPVVVDLLAFMLVRDPFARPTAADVIVRVKSALQGM